MPRVTITALLDVRRIVGWSVKEMDWPGGSVEDLLRAIDLPDAQTLFDLLVEEDRIKDGYAIFVNGRILSGEASADLKTQLDDGDQVATMEVFNAIAGG